MKSCRPAIKYVLTIVLGGALAAGPALADKPSWAGGGNDGKRSEKQHGKQKNSGSSAHASQHFTDRHRVVVREYYGEQFRSGKCPPGLAKKNNGCMPPGQAKKWQVGRSLPHDVIFYEVPHSLVVQIGLPPSGYRYVRVASDILMIAVGTAMVVDAIQDLGRL